MASYPRRNINFVLVVIKYQHSISRETWPFLRICSFFQLPRSNIDNSLLSLDDQDADNNSFQRTREPFIDVKIRILRFIQTWRAKLSLLKYFCVKTLRGGQYRSIFTDKLSFFAYSILIKSFWPYENIENNEHRCEIKKQNKKKPMSRTVFFCRNSYNIMYTVGIFEIESKRIIKKKKTRIVKKINNTNEY